MKPAKIIILLVVALAAIGGVVWAKQYYDSRYVGTDYYTVVPADEPVAITALHDRDGDAVDKGYAYALTGYGDDLQPRLLEFSVSTDNADSLYQPGTYLLVSASEQIVVGETVIERDQVPAEILDKLG